MRLGGWLRPPPDVGWLLASGVLLGLAFPPFDLLVPSFVALVPLGLWLARRPSGEQGRREAFRGGFVMGLLYFTLVLYWLFTALVFYTDWAVLAFLPTVFILGVFMGVAVTGMHQVVKRLRWPLWLAIPLFWTALEWLRGHLGQVSFPWMQLGDSLTAYPWLVGAADLVGSRGISFWLALLNGLLASAVVAWTGVPGGEVARRRAGRLAAAWLLVLALPVAYSAYRWRSLELLPAARVGVIQPNVPEDLKLDRSAATEAAVRSVSRLADSLRSLPAGSREEAKQGLDLLVLPETVLPEAVHGLPSRGWAPRTGLLRWIGSLARGTGAAVLYGAFGLTGRGGGSYEYYNSAFLVDSTGKNVARYDKHYLVPIVERVPFIDPDWLRGVDLFGLGQYFGGFGIGNSREPLRVDQLRFGVLICYESIFAELSRAYRNRGARFLVNITNDAWFGREHPWWSRSSALWQHPAHLVMRAIENRVGVVRSGNTGVSELVDPLGRRSHVTPLFRPAAFRGTVLTTASRTVYDRLGDVVGWASALGAVGAALALGWSSRSPRQAGA